MQPHTPLSPTEIEQLATAIRILAVDATEKANSGHPGAPMGLAEIGATLFGCFMNFSATDPHWHGRDRFILSNGHACLLHYALLHLTGYSLTIEDLKNFRQLNSKTPGHPEHGHTVGIETTTGPLGQGLANAVGMAIANKKMATHVEDIFNSKIYTIVGDGCLMEGISHEAAELAGHLRLNNLIVVWDDNQITIDGSTNLATSTNVPKRFESYGFEVMEVDGHNIPALITTFEKAQTATKPVFIAARTTIGRGAPTKANTPDVHGAPLGSEEAATTRAALNWPHAPFYIPDHIYTLGQKAAAHGARHYAAWQAQFKKEHTENPVLKKWFSRTIPPAAIEALEQFKTDLITTRPTEATRQSSGTCLTLLAEHMPHLLIGSADLSKSNETKHKKAALLSTPNYCGNYIHYGVREHAMAAVMNGISLHGGMIPIGGTFLVFADYLKPSLRLAALMQQPCIFVFTHDSIGLGEDGPTHQPIEHLSMLRSMPNVRTFRPADSLETAECWQLALAHTSGPVCLILSRQATPTLRKAASENLSARGGYILSDSPTPPRGIFIATGTEVAIALEAQALLHTQNIPTRVVSLPEFNLFLEKPADYQTSVLPPHLTARVGIEAAGFGGWAELGVARANFIGMHSFGASAPAKALYQHFNITAAHAAARMKEIL